MIATFSGHTHLLFIYLTAKIPMSTAECTKFCNICFIFEENKPVCFIRKYNDCVNITFITLNLRNQIRFTLYVNHLSVILNDVFSLS